MTAADDTPLPDPRPAPEPWQPIALSQGLADLVMAASGAPDPPAAARRAADAEPAPQSPDLGDRPR